MFVTTSVQISDAEVERIFRARLRNITSGYHLSEDGVLQEEQATSHTYWTPVKNPETKRHQIVIAAIKLIAALDLLRP